MAKSWFDPEVKNIRKHLEDNDVKDQLEKERKRRLELEGLKKVMEEERDELEAVMGKQMSAIEDIEGRCDELITIKIDLDTKMEELQEKLDDEDELNSDLIKHRKKLEIESENLKTEIQELEISWMAPL